MVTETDTGLITLERPSENDYLDTYVKEHNELLETYQWIRGRLNAAQQRAWETNIGALKTLCLALEAGFDPFVTPQGWHKGRLTHYTAPIPADVRVALDVAIPIFKEENVYIVDPNADHFVKSEVRDPAAVGEIRMATGQMFQLLIGCWDLAEDRVYLEAHPVPERTPEWARRFLENAQRHQEYRPLGSGYTSPFPVRLPTRDFPDGGREPQRGLRRRYLRATYGGPEVAKSWTASIRMAVSSMG